MAKTSTSHPFQHPNSQTMLIEILQQYKTYLTEFKTVEIVKNSFFSPPLCAQMLCEPIKRGCWIVRLAKKRNR